MNNIKRNIPNLITISNLTCGLFAIIFSFQGNLANASLCIFLGAFLDFFDGFVARILKVSGEFGKQLDSLADMTTFGIAPGFILFQFIFYLENNKIIDHTMNMGDFLFPSVIALGIPILSAYRLAKFNLDKKQTNLFIGLPTPALAIFIAAIPQINFQQFPMFADIKLIVFFAIVMPLLLIVKIPLFSLKFNNNEKINSRINFLRIILIVAFLIFFFIFKFAAIPFIVILYLILSIINNIFSHYEFHS